MARSTYVYILTSKGQEPAHAFTVKHELLRFMGHPDVGLDGRTVVRLVDGPSPFASPAPVHSWPAAQYFTENT